MNELDIQQERQAFEQCYKVNHKKVEYDEKRDCYEPLTHNKKTQWAYAKETNIRWCAWKNAKRHTLKSNDWISVTERLPASRSREVNVLLKTGEVRIALFEQWIPPGQTKPVHYFTGDIYHVDGIEYQCTVFDNVTHWQPLPNPPVKVEK